MGTCETFSRSSSARISLDRYIKVVESRRAEPPDEWLRTVTTSFPPSLALRAWRIEESTTLSHQSPVCRSFCIVTTLEILVIDSFLPANEITS